ncbi:alpha/beta hydrolase fold domain-containing protein [Streptomyces sp. BG9H]|uniref:Alpha/beta hydrolase fold domain-containing protein n=1 Tax=Streptomyces anatolicus TaxID=2675858 RepID=A0ABS6YTJ9_9ACTN|nr:alpha/beta hydrolase [Streptomyces anatolicus]MBW5424410.1 alpha/beta hydrolase fold domain-containing protein [Streptomyces anatolicus]
MTSVVPPLVARVLLLAGGSLNAALAVLVASPLPRVPLLVLVAAAITSWGLLLVAPGLIGLLAAALAGRRHPWCAGLASLASFAALVYGVMPYAAAYGTAVRQGQPLTPAGYFDGVNYAKVPDRSRTLTYARVGDREARGRRGHGHRLDLDLWALPKRAGVRHPAVVWVHGGGWNKGHRSQTPEWNRWFNARGWSVFDIDYRLAPRATQLDQIGDVKCAVGWVKRHARAYGVDPDRLLLMGSSAGGNLALSAAYTDGDSRVPASCEARDSSVSGVISLYGPTDMRRLIAGTALRADPMMARLMGGSAASAPARYRLGSPARLVRGDLPPTLLLHGGADRAVPVAQARELARRLKGAGAPATYVELPWADHCFDVNWGGWGSQIARAATERFLSRLDRSPYPGKSPA